MAADRSFDHRTLEHVILISNHLANGELIVKVCVWFSFIFPDRSKSSGQGWRVAASRQTGPMQTSRLHSGYPGSWQIWTPFH